MADTAPAGSAHTLIDQLLDGAEILQNEYDDYDAAAARTRIAHAARLPRRTPPGCAESADPSAGCGAPPGLGSVRARYLSHRDQAAHDLDLAVSLVVGAPQAADALGRLVDHRHIQPEGALVFASLLHLVGHTDAAQFWWQFAAGAGSSTAAFCLYLYHQHLGEQRDAAYWRIQADHLRDPLCRTAPAPGSGRAPLLPDHVWQDLLSQCRQNRSPHLPPALESVINGLRVDEHEDFGELPLPARTLTCRLARTNE